MDGDLAVGSEGPRPLGCDRGDSECRMSQALSAVCRPGEQEPQALLGYVRPQGLCARGAGLGLCAACLSGPRLSSCGLREPSYCSHPGERGWGLGLGWQWYTMMMQVHTVARHEAMGRKRG